MRRCCLLLRCAVVVLVVLLGVAQDARAGSQESCSPGDYQVSPLAFGSPGSGGISAAATALDVTVNTPAECTWTVSSTTSWLAPTITAGAGTATVRINALANPGDLRFARVRVAGQDVLVTQAGCLSVHTRPDLVSTFPGYNRHAFAHGDGGQRHFQLHVANDVCGLTGYNPTIWINFDTRERAGSSLLVRYHVAPNTSGAQRHGTFSVGYLTFTVTQAARVADGLNGDASPDLIWHHRTGGQVAAWLMNGTRLVDGRLLEPAQVADTAWKVVGSGDFNEDGHADLVWQHDDGRAAVWTMNGTTQLRGEVLDLEPAPFLSPHPDWRIRAVADLNGDGRPDIVWQNRTTGAIAAAVIFNRMAVYDVTFSPGSVADPAWEIVGAADFDRDGQTDLLWKHQTTGQIATWSLRWSWASTWTVIEGALLEPAQVSDTDWKIRGTADIDRDGQADILWQHQTQGLIAVWLMNGRNLRRGLLFEPGQVADLDWILVGPR